MKDENFVYRNVYTSGHVSQTSYAPGSALDHYTASQRFSIGPSEVAYRLRIRFKDGRNIGGPPGIQGPQGEVGGPAGIPSNTVFVARCPSPIPPLSDSMLKALGAFAMLILVIAFACWFVFEVFL